MDGPWSQGLFQECVYTRWNMVLVPDRPYFLIWLFEVVDESGNPIGSRLIEDWDKCLGMRIQPCAPLAACWPN